MQAFLFLVVFVEVVCCVWGENGNRLTLTSANFCSGEESAPVPYAVPNLESIGWAGRAKGYNQTGIWVYYDTVNYGHDADWECVVHSFNDIPVCYLEPICFLNSRQSFRVVGAPDDYTRETITFYEHDYWRGTQAIFEEDTPTLSVPSASIMITAPTPWTIYDEPNYGGQSACINTFNPYAYNAISDTLEISPPFAHGTIASVRKGCHSPNIHRPQTPQQKGTAWVIETCKAKK